VTNGGFEEIQSSTLIKGWTAIDSSKNAFLPFSIGAPFNNAPGPSFDFQFPRSGTKFIGATVYCHHSTCPDSSRSYPRNRLRELLKQGKTYCAQFYVNVRNESPFGISDYSILLAGPEIDTIELCNRPLHYLQPQVSFSGAPVVDTLGWTAVNGTFVAQGFEKYLVLGNFSSNLATNTVAIQTLTTGALFSDAYFDDVSLVDMDLPAFAGRDTNIASGDSIYIGREPDVGIDYACQWYKLPNDSVAIDTIAGLWVKPTIKTTYIVRQQLWCGGVRWDTVTVHLNSVGIGESQIRKVRIFPNPCQGLLRISGLSEIYDHVISVADATGRTLRTENLASSTSSYPMTLDLPAGIYFLSVRGREGVIVQKILVEK
jgi:hypothetical protein